MADSRRIPSISHYAMIMVVIVLLAFLAFAAITYSEFHSVRADMDATSQSAAGEEVVDAMNRVLEASEAVARRFADWEEVSQQLQMPRYYAYWRSYRLFGTSVLPNSVTDAAIYDADGKVLARLDETQLSAQIGTPPPPAYVDYAGDEPMLLVFAAVYEGPEAAVAGYVGLRIRLLPQLREGSVYRYADPQSINFERPLEPVMTWAQLVASVEFTVRENPMGEAVSRMM